MATNHHPTLTGAEILWATLAGERPTTVFGYPGRAILPIYNAIRGFPASHHVLDAPMPSSLLLEASVPRQNPFTAAAFRSAIAQPC